MNGDALGYQFVDTNVLVYAHDISAGEKHTRAKRLIKELWDSRNGCLSIQVLQEFYVNVTQKVHKPLHMDTAIQIIENLSEWRIHRPDMRDVVDAIRIQRNYHISFWDAMIVQSAAQLGCKVIWTEDLNPGQIYEGVRIENPL